MKITADFDLTITNMTLNVYNYFSEDHNGEEKEYECPLGFETMMKVVNARMYDNKNTFKGIDMGIKQTVLPDSKKVLIGYSSGLDSTYQALRFRDQGYEVILMHCGDLNRSYPDEKKTAEKFAEKYGFKLVIPHIKHGGSQFFIDNPTKNQCVVLSCMMDYAIQNGINNFALGSSTHANYNNRNTQLAVTDAHETYDSYLLGIDTYVKNAKYHHVDIDKIDCYRYLVDNYPEVYKLINSCVSPYRFKKHLNKIQREKFGLKTITDDRCMICSKCIVEYLSLVNIGAIERNEAYIKHACNHIKKKRDMITTVGWATKGSTAEEIEHNIVYGD